MSSENHRSGPSQKSEVYLSIVIRVRNEAKLLRHVFEALMAQRCTFKWEIIVVDNDSDDETLELCKQFKARMFSIGRAEFTHGRALNLGISHARGKLCLLLSAHALPVGSYFLETCVAPFDDPMMAAVRCLAVSVREQLKNWFKPRDIQYRSLDEQRKAEAGRLWINEYPAATCCVIRRSVWEEIRYDEVLESAEDKLWASQALRKGFKIRHCTEAVWISMRTLGRNDRWKKRNREGLAVYRITGIAPLHWREFLVRVGKAILASPLVAIRHIVEAVIVNCYLVTIPWQAKSRRRVGSVPDFDKHK